MHHVTRRLFLGLVLALAPVVGLAGCDRGGPSDANPAAEGGDVRPGVRRIAVIPKGTTHVFWKSVEAGARQAGEELGVEVVWKGPLKENDLSQQKSIVEDFVAQNVDAIVLAPLNQAALASSVANATAQGTAVVIIDSAVSGRAGEDFVSFVATDNHRGGQMGGEKLAELLGGRGKVVLLRYEAGHASTGEREAGFVEAIRQHPGIELIVDNRRGGADASEAQNAAENMLDKLEEADGIFAVNESTTYGMLLALQKHGLAGKKTFVGFDASPPLIAGLEAGQVQALVVQNPTRMGRLGVQAAVDHLDGKGVESRIDTGVALVTAENLGDEAIKAMIGTP